ncbi:MAG: biliverdin-producing heme oxygenase [Candidatus Tectimicrobiota bacterium]
MRHETLAAPGQTASAILEQLKQTTAAAHARIERCVPLLDPGLTWDTYRHWLMACYGFYAPLEARLERLAAGLPADWPQRRKLPLLRQDLQALGLAPGQIARLPLCTALPLLESVPSALGCLYVLEGSTLGGQVLARHLARTLGLQAPTGGAFVQSYGAAVGAMWRAFRVHLVSRAGTPESEQLMLRAACDTFAMFEHWLRQALPGVAAEGPSSISPA